MLPIISEKIIDEVLNDVMSDIHSWRKKMIHYIKEENPEVNTAIIELAQKSDLDPKAIAAGAYMTYMLLEQAAKEDDNITDFEE